MLILSILAVRMVVAHLPLWNTRGPVVALEGASGTWSCEEREHETPPLVAGWLAAAIINC